MNNLFFGIDAIQFNNRFKSEADCIQYLHDIKWGSGFGCIKCGHQEFYKGKTGLHKRCKSCRYDESVTANTIFHKIKVPLLKAFHMAFRTVGKKKGMSSIELSAEVSVQQKTAWLFRLKVKNAMSESAPPLLAGTIQVDETLIGGYSEGAIGRSLEEKQAVLVAVEELPDGRTGNVAMRVIENFKKDTLAININEIVEKEAALKTDAFKSYQSMKKDGRNIEIELSQKGQAHNIIHKQILQLKSWIKGTHHKYDKSHLQSFLNEYCYRFNRRNKRDKIFNSIIFKIMNGTPKSYNDLKPVCALNT